MKRNRELIPEHFMSALTMNCCHYAREAKVVMTELNGWPILTNNNRSVMIKLTRYKRSAGELRQSSMGINEHNFVYMMNFEDVFDYPEFRKQVAAALRQSTTLKGPEPPTFVLVPLFFEILKNDKCLFLDKAFKETYSPRKAFYWFIETAPKTYMFTIRTGGDWWVFHACNIKQRAGPASLGQT